MTNPPLPGIAASDMGPVVGSGAHAIDFSAWGPLEWAGYSAMALVCIWVLWRAVVTTLHPNEDAPDHVKRMILDDDAPLPPMPPRRPTLGLPSEFRK